MEELKQERKNAQEVIYESLELYHTLIEISPDAITLTDLSGKIIMVNQQTVKLHGFADAREILGRNAFELIAPEDRKRAKENMQLTLKNGRVTNVEYAMLKKDGSVFLSDLSASVLKDSDGNPKAFIGITRDITERKQREEALIKSQRAFPTLLSNLPGIAYRCSNDKNWTVEFVSEGCFALTGYQVEDFVQSKRVSFSKLIHPQDKEKVWKDVQMALQMGRPYRLVYRIITANGEEKWVWEQGQGVFSQKGRLAFLEGFITDITDRKNIEHELEVLNRELLRTNMKLKQLALKDSLTGLYNYRYFEDVIASEFDRAKRQEQPLSVIMLDIDYFKSINEVYGHQFGDLLLQQLAQQLKKTVRKYDTVVRCGGEEFIIISPGADHAIAVILAQRLLDVIKLYEFGDKQHKVKLKLSVAVVSYPEDKISNYMDFIQIAEQILDKVKESGGARVYSSLDIRRKKKLSARTQEEMFDVGLLREKIEKLTKRANQSLAEAIFAFAKTIEIKDHYTGEHVEKTVHYATKIAKALGLSKEEVEHIRNAAVLHDLGKIGVSEKILNKKTTLTQKEYAEIKKHPQIGVDILRPIHLFHNILPLILYHHERWDGKGYPQGLKEEDIPIGACIIAIADAYEALTSDRKYRKACSKEKAREIIEKGSGTQFSPRIVNMFLKILQKEQ